MPIHDIMSTQSLSAVGVLTCAYLLQDGDKIAPFKEKFGYCSGFVTTEGDIFTCAACTNPDDAKWVVNSLIAQIKIFTES